MKTSQGWVAGSSDQAVRLATNDDIPSVRTTVVGPSGDKHTHTVIFLHGREDFGSDLAKYFFDSKSSDGRSLAEIFPSIRWVFPTAKLLYSAHRDFEFSNSSFAEALKGEEIISQWFDVWDIKAPEEKQELMVPGLQQSIADIVRLIREETRIVPLDRIILGGISQGCATALLVLLSSGLDLGGFVGWCSWLPFQRRINMFSNKNKNDISRKTQSLLNMAVDKSLDSDGETAANLQETKTETLITTELNSDELVTRLNTLSLRPKSTIRTPIFLAHSKDDETVPFAMGEDMYQTIEDLGFDVTWKAYEDGGHWIQAAHGVDDMSASLEKFMRF